MEVCDFIFNQHSQPLCKWFENLSTESEGPRFNSTRGLRFFALSHACDKTTKIFLDFFTKLKIYHLSFKYYLNKYWNFETINSLETLKNQGLKTMFSFLQCQCFCLYQNPYHIFIFDNFLGTRTVWYRCKSQCMLNLSCFGNNISIQNVFYTLTCPRNSL